MKTCRYCGSLLQDDAKACSYCGRPTELMTDPEAAAANAAGQETASGNGPAPADQGGSQASWQNDPQGGQQYWQNDPQGGQPYA